MKRLTIFIMSAFILLTGCASRNAEEKAIPSPTPSTVVSPESAPDNTPAQDESVPAVWTAAPDASLFSRNGQFISYAGNALTGIDISDYQGDISWDEISGIDFAIIRAGFRGWGSAGTLCEDDNFYSNINGAKSAGLSVGVYFFSQATTPEEAIEEAEFVLDMLSDYDVELPVFFDWEEIEDEPDARTSGLSVETRTKCALAFCDRVANNGYTPGVYLSDKSLYDKYNMEAFSGITLWIAQIQETPEYEYPFSFWQYSYDGELSGIPGSVDLNLYFR